VHRNQGRPFGKALLYHSRLTRTLAIQHVNERHGWPLHVIKSCADYPPMEQPDAFVRALRPVLDTQAHSYSKESHHEYNDKPSTRRDMRSSDCGRRWSVRLAAPPRKPRPEERARRCVGCRRSGSTPATAEVSTDPSGCAVIRP
jgi:hypothetical protein